MMEKKENRLRVWVPDEHLWIHEALEELAVAREAAGEPSSKSREAFRLIYQALKEQP